MRAAFDELPFHAFDFLPKVGGREGVLTIAVLRGKGLTISSATQSSRFVIIDHRRQSLFASDIKNALPLRLCDPFLPLFNSPSHLGLRNIGVSCIPFDRSRSAYLFARK